MGVHERKEREREQRRQDILESARAAFLKHGLLHATMDKIAAEAELAKGTLYLYFRNRDELLVALIAEDMEELNVQLEAVVKSRLRADNKLLRAVETFHQFATENALFYQVMSQVNVQQLIACGGTDNGAMEHFEGHNKQMMLLMTTILREGVEDGVFHLDHPEEYIVLQMIMAFKGTVVIMSNRMLSPAWIQVDLRDLLLDQARLFIKGLSA